MYPFIYRCSDSTKKATDRRQEISFAIQLRHYARDGISFNLQFERGLNWWRVVTILFPCHDETQVTQVNVELKARASNHEYHDTYRVIQ